MKSKVVWKTNSENQFSLLPPSYDDLVPDNHPVRIVNSILDQIDLRCIEYTYKGGGTSSYPPRGWRTANKDVGMLRLSLVI